MASKDCGDCEFESKTRVWFLYPCYSCLSQKDKPHWKKKPELETKSEDNMKNEKLIMNWEDKVTIYGLPIAGETYKCTLRNFHTHEILVGKLVCAGEDDCLWRTVDDLSEINEYVWDVISWEGILT